MVVDDSLMVRRQIAFALSQVGYVVLEASDGQRALEMLERTARIDLIVLDVTMPNMGGIELLQRMHDDGRTGTQVIVLTTEGRTRLMQEAKALGARGWMIKPFKSEMLVAAVRKLLAGA